MLNFDEFRGRRVHFVGIGGISMSALAQILFKGGVMVQGSDVSENDEVRTLRALGIVVFLGHRESNLDGVDTVVYSSAIHEDNIELVTAKKRGLTLLRRAELLGSVAERFGRVVAVCGSHGKTTASAMISEILLRAGFDPSLHIGGKLLAIDSNYRLGGDELFVTEACEYEDNFLHIHPDVAVVLNIDSDHLDYFHKLSGVKKSFDKFCEGIRRGGVLFVCADDPHCKHLLGRENVTSFGFGRRAELRAVNERVYENGKFEFDLLFMGAYLGKIRLNVLGRHNIYNALAAILVALLFDIDFKVFADALFEFKGTLRRSQVLGRAFGALSMHDYAHHPRQIASMISSAQNLPHKKIVVVFEPHTYSRTKFLLKDFAKSFKGTDLLILLPAYSARESRDAGVDSDTLLRHAKKYVKSALLAADYDEAFALLKKFCCEGDLLLVLGAGSIEKLADMIEAE